MFCTAMHIQCVYLTVFMVKSLHYIKVLYFHSKTMYVYLNYTLYVNKKLSCLFCVQIELSKQSATAVILCAFSKHNIKEVSRAQLHSATKLYCTSEEKKRFSKCDKKDDLIIPLASLLLREGIISITDEADMANLSIDDVLKTKTF